MRLSIITPAFNEADNLGAMHERLVAALGRMGVEWEWLVVDDHSRDTTFDVVHALAARDARVRGVRLARNSGSHAAIACGLHHVTGDAAVVVAADLQDPPETLAAMLARWREGAQVVWAVRRRRPGESARALGFARVYYFVMRHLVGMREMPATGADFFLADRAVIDAFRTFPERHASVLALLTWMGYRQAFIEYDKEPRQRGQSGWTFAKKLKLVIDSVTGFSEFPIRLCSWMGLALMLVALIVGVAGVAMLPVAPPAAGLGSVSSAPVPAWVSGGLMLVLAVAIGLSGLQLLALGIVGEYVWRALDEARRRPAYLIEATAGVGSPVVPTHE